MTETATRVYVGEADEFTDGDRRIVEVGGTAIGVFCLGDDFVAYENRCLHQGGPVCEGQYFPRMRAVIDDQHRFVGEKADYSSPQLVCPWHSWEYDLRTGEMVANRKMRLRSYEVVVEGAKVYVVA